MYLRDLVQPQLMHPSSKSKSTSFLVAHLNVSIKRSNIHKLRWKSCYVLTHSSSGFSNTNCHRQTTIKLYEVKVFPLPANTGINSTHITLERQRKETVVMLNVVYSLNLLKRTVQQNTVLVQVLV